jgi:hypothetical protein
MCVDLVEPTTPVGQYNAYVVVLLQTRVCGGVCIRGVNSMLFHIVNMLLHYQYRVENWQW